MNVLLTGACGFVGSHLTRRLLADGHRVTGVDNCCTGRPESLVDIEGHPSLRLIRCNAICPTVGHERFDWVMHLASPASPPKYLALPIETLRVNAEGTYRLLKIAKRSNASFLLTSTSEVYGDPSVHPQTESYWGHVNPVGPRSVYDEAKRYAEAMTTACHHELGVPVRIARLFNTYGPWMDPTDGRVVTNFVTQALSGRPLTVYGSGSQTRSLQYVDDLVDGLIRLMSVDYAGPVNIGNPEEITMLELARLVIDLCRSTSPIEHVDLPVDDPTRRRPDISLARRLLGWEPKIALRDGLLRTIEHLRSL